MKWPYLAIADQLGCHLCRRRRHPGLPLDAHPARPEAPAWSLALGGYESKSSSNKNKKKDKQKRPPTDYIFFIIIYTRNYLFIYLFHGIRDKKYTYISIYYVIYTYIYMAFLVWLWVVCRAVCYFYFRFWVSLWLLYYFVFVFENCLLWLLLLYFSIYTQGRYYTIVLK